MKYKILVLDLDGTLFNSKKQITSITKQAINQAQKAGIIIVLASGRPTVGVLPVAQELELQKYGGYMLSYNGARITNCNTNEIVFQKSISKNDIGLICDIAHKYKTNILTYYKDYVYTEGFDEFLDIECRINKINYKIVDSLTDTVTEDIPKLILLEKGSYLEKIEPEVKEILKDRFSVMRSEPFFLEIMSDGIDKAKSLAKLAQILNISKDEIICCGDGFNDLTMIEYAGLGVAMENAQPVVKEKADYITLSNDNDGIVHVINKFIL